MTEVALFVRKRDQVLEILRARLLRSDAQVGTRLPSERDLSAELGVSRRVLRDALQILEDEGVIKRSQGAGTVVVKLPSTIASSSKLENIRRYTRPVELMDARYALEPTIAAMAALHATSEDIDRMYECISASQKVGQNTQAWDKWDAAFHYAMGQATNNSILLHFYEILTAAREQTEWGRLRQATLTPEYQINSVQQHTAIVQAIEQRDAELARSTMKEHLSLVRQTLMDQLNIGS